MIFEQLRDQYDCGMSLSTQLFKYRMWRERLREQYTDPRIPIAAEMLTTLGNEVKILSESQWESLKPYFLDGPVEWRAAVSATNRMVGFKSRIKNVPTYIDALLENLESHSAVHSSVVA